MPSLEKGGYKSLAAKGSFTAKATPPGLAEKVSEGGGGATPNSAVVHSLGPSGLRSLSRCSGSRLRNHANTEIIG